MTNTKELINAQDIGIKVVEEKKKLKLDTKSTDKEITAALKEKLGKKRIILNDNQRMRLARLGKKLGRKVLASACCTFSPDTIMMWHRKLIAKKYDGSGNRNSLVASSVLKIVG